MRGVGRLKCEGSWCYLEAIFQSEDVAFQIPEETRKFRQVDAAWRRINANLV